MKLQKLKKLKFPNLELQIVKQFRKKDFNSKTDLRLIEVLLNKIANVTYFYHVTGKTILFLGFPANFSKVLKTTKHLLVPEFMWQNSMFSNNINLSNKNKKAKTPKNIFKLKTKLKEKKVDLMIINNVDNKKVALKESFLARIPTIVLTEDQDIAKLRYSYNSTGSFSLFSEKEQNRNFVFLFLKSVLLRATKYNKGSIHPGHNFTKSDKLKSNIL